MRAFLAFPLPETGLKNKIALLLKEAQKNISGKIKWVEIKNLHLTLKFLGEINNTQKEKLIVELENLIQLKKFSPLELKISQTGFFPNPFSPKVFWLGFKKDENLKKLINLIYTIDKKLTPLGIKKEMRKPHPHLTLGRIKYLNSPINMEKLNKILEELNLKKARFPLTHFTLYQSQLTPRGPIYTPVHHFPFA
jgi:2'-5' RNA ligase